MYGNEKLQKFLAILILVLVPVFIFKEYKGYALRKNKEDIFVESMIQNEYAKKTSKSFVFIVFSKEEFPKAQVESIFSQTYCYFRVVYLYRDEEAKAYKDAISWVEEHKHQEKFYFVKRLDQEQELSCFYSVLQSCLDDEIVVHLDTEDVLFDHDVLSKLNHTYLDPDVWLAYSESSKNISELRKKVGDLKPFRGSKSSWMGSPIKSYYAGFLKQVTPSLEFLKQVYSNKEDETLMPSLQELGKWHVKEIKESLTKQKSS